MTVTFDTNVIEGIVDPETRPNENKFKIIHDGIVNGKVKGFVGLSYFTIDSISESPKTDALSKGCEIILFGKNHYLGNISQIPANTFAAKTLDFIRKSNMKVLPCVRIHWPRYEGLDSEDYIHPRRDYKEKVQKAMKIVEEKLGCGMASFKEKLGVSDNLKILPCLWRQNGATKHLKKAFSEIADGDLVIFHFVFGIDYLCTDDFASHAGERSVFHPKNRRVISNELGVKFVTSEELANMLESEES